MNEAEKALKEALWALNRATDHFIENQSDRDRLYQARDTVWEVGVIHYGWKD